MKLVLRLFFLFLIPALLIFITTDTLLNINISNDKKKDTNIKIGAYIVGAIVSYLVVPILNESDKNKIKKLKEINQALLNSHRKNVNDELSDLLNNGQDIKLSIRIFVPKRSFNDLLTCKKHFKIINYEGLYVRDVDELEFQVHPERSKQGLVGQVYCERKVKYDFDLNSNHSNVSYNLDANQLNKTMYCNLAIAAPIFWKSSNKITAIVTFDSELKIQQPASNDWQDIIVKNCKIIHKCHTLIT